jgi:two-component system, chemotaxis family, sensor kinase CheA
MDEERKYVKIFISVSLELLQKTSDDLLELENNLEDINIVNRLFRSLHTLKGGAALDGLEKISSVAHLMEDIFGLIRDNAIKIESNYIDVFLESVDVLKELVEGIGSNYEDIDNVTILDKLKEIYNNIAPDKATTSKSKESTQPFTLSDEEAERLSKSSNNIYRIECRFDEQDRMKNVNAFVIMNNLKSICPFIKPSLSDKEIKDNNFEFTHFIMVVETDSDKNTIIPKISSNCKDFTINLLDKGSIKKMNYTGEIKIRSMEEIKEELLKKHSKDLMKAIKNDENVWFVELNFNVNNSMNGVMAYIIYKNIKNKCSNIITSLDPDEFKQKTDLKTLLMYLSSNSLQQNDLTNVIKTNCYSFHIVNLSEIDLRQYLQSENTAQTEANKRHSDTKQTQSQSAYLEVDKDIVDGVIEHIGQLVLNLNVLMQIFNSVIDADLNDIDELKKEIKAASLQLNATAVFGNSLMDYAVLLRLVPVKQVFKKFPRIVRDISKKVDKQVKLIIEGERTRMDQEILDAIEAPILHMIRNSMDHGIEDKKEREKLGKPPVGTITLSAEQVQNKVNIRIEDDGKGMDKDKILNKALKLGLINGNNAQSLSDEEIFSFIYHPGFSTSEKVSQISGRGVGMDVVATEIKKIGGDIIINSEKGKGTNIILNLPITL